MPEPQFSPVDHDPFAAGQVRQLFIVRHGATKLNAEAGVSVDRERGWSDVPLTEEGREEAREAAAKLKSKGIQVIVSSDLKRAKETAKIIGEELGIKPEFSFELRPWNLGAFTEKDMTEVTPQIRKYACETPDKQVPEGESFHEFRDRVFKGLAEALAKHPGEQILIVAHHRVERLAEAFNEAGQLPDHTIDIDVFLEDGAPPGEIKIIGTTEAALRGHKFTHEEVDFGEPKGRDRCANCRAYVGENDCKKVVAPIDEDDWCKVGVSKKGGHPFDKTTGIGSHPMEDEDEEEEPFHPSSIGARQGSDGEHYLPDAGRPGRYMQVVWKKPPAAPASKS